MFRFGFYGIQSTLSATKCNDGRAGLVRVRGWTRSVGSGKAVAFTILDEDDQEGWTRLIDGGMSRSIVEPLEVDIPRSSVRHRIKVTARVLKSRSGGVSGVGGEVEHLEVSSEGSCTATEELASVDANALAHLLSGMSMSSTNTPDISDTIQVSIEQATTFSKATVNIGPHSSIYSSSLCLISVKPAIRNPYASCTEHVFILPKQERECQRDFDLPISLKAGRKYNVVVQVLSAFSQPSTFTENSNFRIDGRGAVEFKAELTISDIKKLHHRAVAYARYRGSAYCEYLYRNKPQPYFDDIFLNHDGLMEVYAKDNSGDPGSPINGRLSGLFFMASVEPGSVTGQPTRASAFGGTRLLVPAVTLLQRASNLYFADFYCMRGQFHYVTLVMTRPGSDADEFCSRRLLLLSVYDPTENPFLFYDGSHQVLQVSTRDHLHVELLFTENLDINQYRYDLRCNTPLIGKGQSTPGGIRKKPNCTTCNISPAGYSASYLTLTDDF